MANKQIKIDIYLAKKNGDIYVLILAKVNDILGSIFSNYMKNLT